MYIHGRGEKSAAVETGGTPPSPAAYNLPQQHNTTLEALEGMQPGLALGALLPAPAGAGWRSLGGHRLSGIAVLRGHQFSSMIPGELWRSLLAGYELASWP